MRDLLKICLHSQSKVSVLCVLQHAAAILYLYGQTVSTKKDGIQFC